MFVTAHYISKIESCRVSFIWFVFYC